MIVRSVGSPLHVGLIGLGAIGRGVLSLLERDGDGLQIVGALVRDPRKSRGSWSVPLYTALSDLLAAGAEVVVEAAGHTALQEHGPGVLRAGRDLVVVSVGALAVADVHSALLDAAREGGSRIRVASGAIGALDALASAAVGGLERVTHTTRKPARALLAADEAAHLTEPRELFHGPAREGVQLFPESVNVAAAVSLAGIGFDRTTLRVVADPTIDRNQHVVEMEGAFGSARFEIRNIPSDENPKTGRLVAMSVLHTLRQIRAPLVLG